uniref:GTPase EngC n=1 Tax=Paulinella longichromatophora TaxID=1708747 RepID=A0A2H4ZPE8_9EUKA|nr:GTPase EngC [Paulinella longichromatophora]
MDNDTQQRYKGLVIALHANFYQVRLHDEGLNGTNELLCIARTRLTQKGERICVGDQVEVEAVDWKEKRAAVAYISPRLSILERPMVANCTKILVVIALIQPNINADQLSRFLLSAEATDLPIDIVFNKSDLVDSCLAKQWQERVKKWGYHSFLVSSVTTTGMEQLRQSLNNSNISVICGPSGVGKTSLINTLIPSLSLKVGKVSGRLQRGRHTTRHVQLFPVGTSGMIADTPGFNRPNLPKDPHRLGWLFPEIRNAFTRKPCRFRNCLHQRELGCSVGTEWERYNFYIQSLETLLAIN